MRANKDLPLSQTNKKYLITTHSPINRPPASKTSHIIVFLICKCSRRPWKQKTAADEFFNCPIYYRLENYSGPTRNSTNSNHSIADL